MKRRVLIVVGGAVILTAGTVIATAGDFGGSEDDSGSRAGGGSARAVESAALAKPPARVCDSARALDGPKSPPSGAVRVATTDSLADLTQSNPSETTFWLEPGVHTLSTGEFSQVIPKDGNTYVGAPDAVLDGQHDNRYAFTGEASDVTIKNLTIENFGTRAANNNEGVVNHNSAPGWVIEDNTITANAGAGVMIGSDNIVRGNCLAKNGQYGFSVYHADGVRNITIESNEIAGNNVDDWEKRIEGCGCTGGGKFWEVTGATVQNNWVHDNRGAGLWADTNNAGFTFERNYISDNDAEGLMYETSYNAAIVDNVFARNGLVKGPSNPGFPTGAVYISEAGSDPRVDTDHSEAFEVSGNTFTDNWSGIIIWENADRFAGSPSNTSTGAGTLVNPDATADTCKAGTIESKPYRADCRWKSQNIKVHDNDFRLAPNEVGADCKPDNGCGFNGLFANWGTYPEWSPYQGDVIQEAITFEQGNEFSENTYAGPWRFVVYDQQTKVDWTTWQAAPYGQDAGSIIKVR